MKHRLPLYVLVFVTALGAFVQHAVADCRQVRARPGERAVYYRVLGYNGAILRPAGAPNGARGPVLWYRDASTDDGFIQSADAGDCFAASVPRGVRALRLWVSLRTLYLQHRDDHAVPGPGDPGAAPTQPEDIHLDVNPTYSSLVATSGPSIGYRTDALPADRAQRDLFIALLVGELDHIDDATRDVRIRSHAAILAEGGEGVASRYAREVEEEVGLSRRDLLRLAPELPGLAPRGAVSRRAGAPDRDVVAPP
jgi:hypothetical protein